MSYVYARDLKDELKTDEWMGKGFEAKLREAERRGVELLVGKFFDTPIFDEYSDDPTHQAQSSSAPGAKRAQKENRHGAASAAAAHSKSTQKTHRKEARK